MAALGKIGLWRDAISEVDSAIQSGLSLDSYVYGSCIGAVAHSGRWQEALNLLRRMRGEGIAPTTPVFNAVIKACSRGGQLKAVFALLDEMCAGEGATPAVAPASTPHVTRTSPRRRVHHSSNPDIQTFNTVISACGRAGEWELALEVMSQAKERQGLRLTRVTYNAAIAACGKSGRVERAVELLGEMRNAGLVPDAMSFNSAMLACAERGSWKQALLLLREMESSGQIEPKGEGPRPGGISPDEFSYSSAIVACGRGGRWSLGVGLLDSMRRKGVSPSTVSYNAAMTACGDAGQWQRAVELLREMQAAQRTEGLEKTAQVPTASAPTPDAISYNVAIRACSNAGQWQPALSLLEEMRQQSHAEKKESAEPKRSSADSRVASVSDPLHVALNGSSGKSDRSSPSLLPPPDVISYSTAVAACARAGQWRRTLALLELMRREGPAPNSATFSGAIAACVRRLRRVGESSCELPPSLLLAELIEHMRLSVVPPSAPCYTRALEACVETGLCEESRSLVDEMVAAEVRIDQSVPKAVAKACMSAALCRKSASVTPLSRSEA